MNVMKDRFVAKKYWKDEAPTISLMDELAKKYDDIIDLSLGDPDLITNKLIIDKTYQDMLKGHTKYTDFRGDPELRDEIAKFYKEEYGYDVSDKEIHVTTSATHGMCLALCAVLDPGDEVIVHAPYFSFYTEQIEFAGGVPVILDCYEEEEFQINPQRLEALINERTRAIIINTPNNPTGICMSRKTLEDIAELAQKNDLLIIADDIYTSFSYGEPFIPITTLPGMRERTITLNTFSKNFTMTGWRIGNIIAPPAIIKAVNRVNDAMVFTAPSISQRAAIYALRYRNEIQPPMIEEYRKRMFYAAERIGKIKNLSVLPPKGTFYLFVNIKKMNMSSEQASAYLLDQAHVLTVPGDSFGSCGEGYVRIACTKSIDVLKQAFDRLEKVEILMN